MSIFDFLLASTNWKMEYEIRFSSFNEKWKMENGCSYSIFCFSLSLENENNGMYTDPGFHFLMNKLFLNHYGYSHPLQAISKHLFLTESSHALRSPILLFCSKVLTFQRDTFRWNFFLHTIVKILLDDNRECLTPFPARRDSTSL